MPPPRALLLAALVLCACGDSDIGDTDILAGERMYRDGLLLSGEPMTALVAGDVPIAGTQFSCESCHGRSGMGAAEGAFIVPPIAAQFLFAPSPQPERPAYDRDSLARVLRDGITPSGRELMVELMPRYELDDGDVNALMAYLETLSAGNSPGVDDRVLRIATVTTEGVDPAEREALLTVLNSFADDINQQTRNDGERWDRGYTPESRLPTVFRDWVLDEWVLSGPSSTWDKQLQRYYRQQPVFAMLSGLGSGDWGPISGFCEQQKLLCLFPSTDLPDRNDRDFYTLFFSRGLLLEADLIAAHLVEQPVRAVVQVYCDNGVRPAVTALEQTLRSAGIGAEEIHFDCNDALPASRVAPHLGDDDAAAVIWAGPEQLGGVSLPAGRAYVSSTLLDQTPGEALAGLQGPVYIAHPFRLPGTVDSAMRRFQVWARLRDVEITAPRVQAEAFFACLVFNDVVKHMGRFRIREFALDMIDHAEGLAAYLPQHPRPTFGPGQRYLNKGGYVLPVVDGWIDTSDAKWIVP